MRGKRGVRGVEVACTTFSDLAATVASAQLERERTPKASQEIRRIRRFAASDKSKSSPHHQHHHQQQTQIRPSSDPVRGTGLGTGWGSGSVWGSVLWLWARVRAEALAHLMLMLQLRVVRFVLQNLLSAMHSPPPLSCYLSLLLPPLSLSLPH